MRIKSLGLAIYLREQTQLLDAERVAQLLRLSKDTIYSWARAGRIPALRSGDNLRFDPKELADWLELGW